MSETAPDFKGRSAGVEQPTRRSGITWMIGITLALGAILSLMEVSLVGVALRYIQGSFDATDSEIGWVVNGYGLANVGSFILVAGLGGRLGCAKIGLLVSLLVFLLASILCGLAVNPSMLIFARVLQGLGSGALLAKTRVILFRTFSMPGQGVAIVVIGLSAIVLGPVLGPTLGGYLVDTLMWRWNFWVNIPLGILIGMLALVFVPADSPDQRRRPMGEWIGIAFGTAGLAGWNFFFGGSHS